MLLAAASKMRCYAGERWGRGLPEWGFVGKRGNARRYGVLLLVLSL